MARKKTGGSSGSKGKNSRTGRYVKKSVRAGKTFKESNTGRGGGGQEGNNDTKKPNGTNSTGPRRA